MRAILKRFAIPLKMASEAFVWILTDSLILINFRFIVYFQELESSRSPNNQPHKVCNDFHFLMSFKIFKSSFFTKCNAIRAI